MHANDMKWFLHRRGWIVYGRECESEKHLNVDETKRTGNVFTHTLPSGVSKKQIGSNDAFAQEIHDVTAEDLASPWIPLSSALDCK